MKLCSAWVTEKPKTRSQEQAFLTLFKFLEEEKHRFESFQRRWLRTMVTMVPHVIFLLWLFQPFAQGLSICFTFSALSLSVLQFSFWIWFKPGKFLFNPHYDLHLASSLVSSVWMIFYIFIRIPSVLKVNVSYHRLPLHKHPIWKWYLVLRWYHTGGSQ